MKIKVCGLRSVEDAATVRAHAVDLAGVVFVPGSRRYVEPDLARAIRLALEPITLVGVFRDAPVADVLAVIDAVGLRRVQLHGNEPLAVVRQIAARCPVVRALSVEALDHLDVEALSPHVEAFLVDGAEPGSGVLAAHTEATRARLGGHPFYVAGGLTADNVRGVVDRVRPDGVDVATGVTVDGRLSAARLAAFVDMARGAHPARAAQREATT